MIGRRCKAGDSLSRAALIARALTRRIPAGAAACAWRVQLRSKRDIRSGWLAVRPPGHAEGSPQAWEARERRKTSAAHRSAAMAGGARPDPFRTRKLSRRAPMVLRGQPVGEQGAADRWTALDPYAAGSGAGRRGGQVPSAAPPSFFSISFSRGPSGALFACRGGPRPSAASPGRPFAGRAEPPISAAGAGRRLPRGASCGHGEGSAIQLSGARPAFMSPFLSEKKSPDHPSSARPSPGMSLRALSPPLLWMITDMVLHLRTSCLPRGAWRARGALGDLDMCAKRGDRYSRPRGASPLASLIPARRQPQGGPARVP